MSVWTTSEDLHFNSIRKPYWFTDAFAGHPAFSASQNLPKKKTDHRHRPISKITDHGRYLLWHPALPGKQLPAVWHQIHQLLVKPALSPPVILSSFLIIGIFLRKEMQPVYLDRCHSVSVRSLSSLPDPGRGICYWKRRTSGSGLCLSCFPYIFWYNRPFLASCRRCKNVLHPVFCLWNPFRYPGIDFLKSPDLTRYPSPPKFQFFMPVVMSCGVAYTLQIIGQKNMNPTVASLILSLESCISVIAGWLILGQNLNSREIWGCILMFGAIILAQLATERNCFPI